MSRDSHKSLTLALAASVLMHLFVLVSSPKIELKKIVPPEPLRIELILKKPQQPQIDKVPEPIKRISKATPTPQKILKKSQPVATNIATAPLPKLANEPPPQSTELMSATPKADTPTLFAVPRLEFQATQEPPIMINSTQKDRDDARHKYGSLISLEIAKYKQYPKLAQLRDWQGEVKIEVQLDESGSIIFAKIHTSSGYELLDQQALTMVKKALPLPLPPEILRNKPFSVLVPISFILD